MVLPATTFAAATFDASGGSTGGRLLVVDPTAAIRAAPLDPARPARTSADTSVLSGVYSDLDTETPGSSDESGRYEIYVQSYPGGANPVPVSNEGGNRPMRTAG